MSTTDDDDTLEYYVVVVMCHFLGFFLCVYTSVEKKVDVAKRFIKNLVHGNMMLLG